MRVTAPVQLVECSNCSSLTKRRKDGLCDKCRETMRQEDRVTREGFFDTPSFDKVVECKVFGCAWVGTLRDLREHRKTHVR